MGFLLTKPFLVSSSRIVSAFVGRRSRSVQTIPAGARAKTLTHTVHDIFGCATQWFRPSCFVYAFIFHVSGYRRQFSVHTLPYAHIFLFFGLKNFVVCFVHVWFGPFATKKV